VDPCARARGRRAPGDRGFLADEDWARCSGFAGLLFFLGAMLPSEWTAPIPESLFLLPHDCKDGLVRPGRAPLTGSTHKRQYDSGVQQPKVAMARKISIVVPVYFNSGSLPDLFKAFQALKLRLAKKGLGTEFIFVDDGSGDGSLELLLRFRKGRSDTRVVKLSRNFGSIHAIKTGYQQVKGDAFTYMAADLQDPPELVEAMVDEWIKGSKFVICERISREDPWLSRQFSRVYYAMVRRWVIPGYPGGGFDLALMDRSLLPFMTDSSKSAYSPLLAYWLGFKPTVIPYHRRARLHGKSRWTFGKKVSAFLDVMLGFSVQPIRFMSMLGIFISLLSFAYGINVVVHALLGKVPVVGFASLASLVAFLVGLVILMLGVIGEYLWRIFEELNRRPETVIERVY
jgi:dolichol-phosphate mannosyltransferase